MLTLPDVFAKQYQSIENAEDADTDEAKVFVYFCWGEHTLVVPVDIVLEVVERQPVVRYPVSVLGHIGVISLRGCIIPVINPLIIIEPESLDQNSFQHQGKRFVVLDLGEGAKVCMMAESVGKVILNKDEIEDGEIVKVGEQPARILAKSDFLSLMEMNYE